MPNMIELLRPHWHEPANSYSLPNHENDITTNDTGASSADIEPEEVDPNRFEDVPLDDMPASSTQNGEKAGKKKRKWFYKHPAGNIISFLLLASIIAFIAWFSYDEWQKEREKAANLKHGIGLNTTTPGNTSNATNMTMTLAQRALPVVTLPLWDDEITEEDVPEDLLSLLPNEKAECSMKSRKPQCYTGHLCYKRKCVSWCNPKWKDSHCYEGHTCLRKEKGTNWRLCSLDPDHQVPCTENYKPCKENGDCCTGSCQARGKYMVCVPPKEFERGSPFEEKDLEREE